MAIQEIFNNKKIKIAGKNITLVGRKIQPNTWASNFKVVDEHLNEVTLNDFKQKIKVITTFVSLDTPVCDLQIKEFNQRALQFSTDVVVLGISKDLPFAGQRFCKENSLKNIQLLSDYQSSSFGINYGLLIKENNLLARSIIIIDKNNVIRYAQIVDEITTAPSYDDALTNLENIIKSPLIKIDVPFPTHCEPCEKGTPPLEKSEIEKHQPTIKNWQVIEDKKLVKEFVFDDFVTAKYFLDLLAVIAEEQGHHPNFSLIYNKLKVTLTTHASGGLTVNDFIMAKIIDGIE